MPRRRRTRRPALALPAPLPPRSAPRAPSARSSCDSSRLDPAFASPADARSAPACALTPPRDRGIPCPFMGAAPRAAARASRCFAALLLVAACQGPGLAPRYERSRATSRARSTGRRAPGRRGRTIPSPAPRPSRATRSSPRCCGATRALRAARLRLARGARALPPGHGPRGSDARLRRRRRRRSAAPRRRRPPRRAPPGISLSGEAPPARRDRARRGRGGRPGLRRGRGCASRPLAVAALRRLLPRGARARGERITTAGSSRSSAPSPRARYESGEVSAQAPLRAEFELAELEREHGRPREREA